MRQPSRPQIVSLPDRATRFLALLLIPGTRQSRSCGLKQLDRALRVAGVVAVGGGDVRVAVQAQYADGQAAQ